MFFKSHGTCAPLGTSGLSVIIISIICFLVKPRTIVQAPSHVWTHLNNARATCQPRRAQKPGRAEHWHRIPLGPLRSKGCLDVSEKRPRDIVAADHLITIFCLLRQTSASGRLLQRQRSLCSLAELLFSVLLLLHSTYSSPISRSIA